MQQIITEAEISAIVLSISWIIKIFFRPSKTELGLLLNIAIYLVSFLRKWSSEHSTHLGYVGEQLTILQDYFRKDKIIKG